MLRDPDSPKDLAHLKISQLQKSPRCHYTVARSLLTTMDIHDRRCHPVHRNTVLYGEFQELSGRNTGRMCCSTIGVMDLESKSHAPARSVRAPTRSARLETEIDESYHLGRAIP